jgi:AraC-like DNA-binding protein
MSLALEQIGFDSGKSFRLLTWTDNLSDVVQCRADGSRVKLAGRGDRWHFHPEYELTLVTKGKGKRFVGDHVENFQSPDLVLIGPNLPHCWPDLDTSSGFALQFVLDSNHPLGQLHEMRALETMLQDSNFGIRFAGPVVERIEHSMRALASLPMLERLAEFIGVLAELAAVPRHEQIRLSDSNLMLGHQGNHAPVISRAVSFLLSNLEKEIGINDLLKVTHMSKPTFSRHFKSHTGRSLTSFLNEVRIVNAKRLLAETNDSITDIAYSSGFRNLSHFNVQFRRSSNKSPRDFRKDLRGRV